MPETSAGELAREQKYVAALYERLDVLRERTRRQLDDVLAQGASGTHQNRSERDTFAVMYAQRLARLWAVENRLCFGRLDHADETSLYIGRIGLSDDEQHRLLIDWRAPVAQPFYRATPAAPMGLTRRRHLHTKGRKVTGVDDDLLDLDRLTDADRATLNGEAALLAALDERRTGRMRDIVATIQAEQDAIIRSDLNGVLVVQGGPGTGKTVVALHRAAYLLYTYRDRLERRGVLVLGPNPTFMRYIDQVLPSLGETDVLLSTIGDLYPGVTAVRSDPPEAAAIKGSVRMAEVVAAAVGDRQRIPDRPLEIRLDKFTLRLDVKTFEAARAKALRARKPHNEARPVFVRHLLNTLTRQAARKLGRGMLDEADFAELREDLRTEEPVRAALNRLWPYLTPQRLLIGLFTSAQRMAAAGLTEREREALLREPPRPGEGGAWWSDADVPLLDEAAELLGHIDEGVVRAARIAEEERRERIAYAREVLELTGMADIMDAERFAARQEAEETQLTTAERAARDRTWAFGHVIVDEAQELSEMAWRMVMRRCPSRSMTIVGDIAQTGSSAGAASWGRMLDPYVGGRWREAVLTVNYRTPAESMAVAARVLELVGPDLKAPESVRETGERPWALRVAELSELGPLVREEIVRDEESGVGRLVVIVPASAEREIGALVTAAVPGAVAVPGPAALDAPVAVLAVADAKGLEFDSVIVVEPSRILGESPRGPSDLYVAVTRATRRLGVVHTGVLPAALTGLADRIR
ncbi:HelD family protein [Sphaerimonospora thailandensis]|uniref:DNA helicase n=1 Tax=Sphaerimonospora thailandensis TaxID=795644 RepID=A0A8J3RFK9_9ACTN|nr:DNA/RNA helicase domain-containing protein [Sphaerimonospora thailandensis]GIH72849.1 DNA helicase [Sphaerimonospora thailandensis]